MRDMTRNRRNRKWRVALAIAATASLALAGCTGQEGDSEATANAEQYDLIGGDTVLLNTTPSMPNTGMENGELVGFEAEMFQKAMKELGLEYKVTVTDFPGALAAVQSARQDVAIGNIAWRDSRAETGLLTDPPFYVPQILMQKKGQDLSTIEDLKGKTVGTISGFIFIDVLQEMDQVNMRVYPDAAATVADLAAGRLDVALLDPLMAIYTASTRPELDLEAVAIEAPTEEFLAANPGYDIFGPVMIGWYLPQSHTKLESALSDQIRNMYADGTTADLMKKYGIDDPDAFLSVSNDWAQRFAEQRSAVDRESDWSSPSNR